MKKMKLILGVGLLGLLLCGCSGNHDSSGGTEPPSREHIAGDPVEENIVDATCTEDGSYDLVTYCTECNEELNREHKTLGALGHDLIHHDEKIPSCTVDGWAEYYTCSRCDYSTYAVIPATGHQHTDSRRENINEASCYVDGSYDLVTYCLDDDVVISREHVVIPAHHTFSSVYYEWSDDYAWCRAYHICLICEYEATIEKVYTIKEIIKQPTAMEEGIARKIANFTTDGLEDKYYEYHIPATGSEDKLVFEYDNELKGYSVRAISTDIEGDVVIPFYHSLGPVVAIQDEGFNNCKKITSITIPVTMKHIGYNAFASCYSITDTYLWHENEGGVINIKSFMEYKASGCRCVGDIHLISKSGEEFKTVEISYDFRESLENCKHIETVDMSEYQGTTFPEYAFKDCSSLANVILPNTIKKIPMHGFNGCTSLEHIDLPNDLTRIQDSAFSNCASLKEIEFGSKLEIISSFAFENCSQLTNINIPSNIKTLDTACFSGCYSLVSIILNEGLMTIGSGAFSNCDSIDSIDIPTSVTSVGKNAFSNITTRLFHVDSISDFMSISRDDRGSTRLFDINGEEIVDVVIPNDVTSIKSYCFYNCNGIKSVTLGQNVTSIGQESFRGCVSLESIILNSKLESIGMYAFRNCVLLKNVTIPDSVQNIYSGIFKGCDSLESLVLPFIGGATNRMKFLAYLFDDDTWKYGECVSSLTTIVLSSYCVAIPDHAFYLQGTLVNISMTDNVTYIGEYAFNSCGNLQTINISKNITEIKTATFGGCESLTSIAIPNKVKKIATWAFSGCASLNDIVFEGTIEEWNNIAKGTDWNKGVPATLVHCDDGDVNL